MSSEIDFFFDLWAFRVDFGVDFWPFLLNSDRFE